MTASLVFASSLLRITPRDHRNRDSDEEDVRANIGNEPSGGEMRPTGPRWNPAFHGNLCPHTASEFFNPTAFLPTATGTLGNYRATLSLVRGFRSWISRQSRRRRFLKA